MEVVAAKGGGGAGRADTNNVFSTRGELRPGAVPEPEGAFGELVVIFGEGSLGLDKRRRDLGA